VTETGTTLIHRVRPLLSGVFKDLTMHEGTRVDITNWSCIEYCTALICSSLPHLKPLIIKTIPGFFSSRYGSRATAYPPANTRSKKSAYATATKDNTADDFYGDKRGRISNIVTGGIRSGVSRLDNDSTEEILRAESGADIKDWHIMKTINIKINEGSG
jgi:hypothetical protein